MPYLGAVLIFGAVLINAAFGSKEILAYPFSSTGYSSGGGEEIFGGYSSGGSGYGPLYRDDIYDKIESEPALALGERYHSDGGEEYGDSKRYAPAAGYDVRDPVTSYEREGGGGNGKGVSRYDVHIRGEEGFMEKRT